MNEPAEAALLDSPLATGVLVIYLIALLGIGVWGRLSSQEKSMPDFFLAGRGLGGFALLLTLFATQYSGNTLVGMPGQTYRTGYAFVVMVPFFVAIIGAAMVFAPGLQGRAEARVYHGGRCGTRVFREPVADEPGRLRRSLGTG